MVKKKNWLFVLILVFVASSLGFGRYWFIQKKYDSLLMFQEIRTLPNFTFFNARDMIPFTQKDLVSGRKVWLLYYSPDCEHCQDELTQLSKNIHRFEDIEIVLISEGDPRDLIMVKQAFGLQGAPNVYSVWDKDGQFEKVFKLEIWPCSILYNDQRQLVWRYNGLVDMESLFQMFAHGKPF